MFDTHPTWIADAASYAKDLYFADMIVVNPHGEEIALSELIYADAEPYYFEPENHTFHIHKELPDNYFWKIGHPKFPLIRVSGYSFDCYNVIHEFSTMLRVTDLADYAIEDVLKKTKRYYSRKRKTVISLQ